MTDRERTVIRRLVRAVDEAYRRQREGNEDAWCAFYELAACRDETVDLLGDHKLLNQYETRSPKR